MSVRCKYESWWLNFFYYRLGILLAELIIGLVLVEQQKPDSHLYLPLDYLSSILGLLNNVVEKFPKQFVERDVTSWPGIFGNITSSWSAVDWHLNLFSRLAFVVTSDKSAWPTNLNEPYRLNVMPLARPSVPKQLQTPPVIRRAEFENHNKDGGLWLKINDHVFDIQDFKYISYYWVKNFISIFKN